MTTCNCPRIDGYILRRKSCGMHQNRADIIGETTIAAPPVDEDAVCAWADYRKDYGVSSEHMSAAHKAFMAGWLAASEGDQSGVSR